MTLLQKYGARLRNQTAWVIGGKRIGQFVAKALAEQGVHIIASYHRSRTEADAMARMARGLGVQSLVLRADVSNRRQVAQAVRTIARHFPKLHILVNMASVFWPTPLAKIRETDWQANIASHVLGTFWPVQQALPLMPKGAHIITIADRTSIGPSYEDYLPYVTTKGAVQAMTRALARELGPRGIFVNAIAPGPIRPPDFMPRKEWKALRQASVIDFPIDDQEAQEQFALLVLYLSTLTLASGWTYALDQGQNL